MTSHSPQPLPGLVSFAIRRTPMLVGSHYLLYFAILLGDRPLTVVLFQLKCSQDCQFHSSMEPILNPLRHIGIHSTTSAKHIRRKK
jgi:hypothetical protein